MDVKLGTGLATGMFYHAPAGTALPTDPTAYAYERAGFMSEMYPMQSITLSMNKSTQNLKNWANAVKRVILTEHSETIQAPVMDTTEESLKTVPGRGKCSAHKRRYHRQPLERKASG